MAVCLDSYVEVIGSLYKLLVLNPLPSPFPSLSTPHRWHINGKTIPWWQHHRLLASIHPWLSTLDARCMIRDRRSEIILSQQNLAAEDRYSSLFDLMMLLYSSLPAAGCTGDQWQNRHVMAKPLINSQFPTSYWHLEWSYDCSMSCQGIWFLRPWIHMVLSR